MRTTPNGVLTDVLIVLVPNTERQPMEKVKLDGLRKKALDVRKALEDNDLSNNCFEEFYYLSCNPDIILTIIEALENAEVTLHDYVYGGGYYGDEGKNALEDIRAKIEFGENGL